MGLTAEQVRDFLRSQPDFFDTHSELLGDIVVPHPHGGRAIPLSERQMVALRDKNRALETKISELIQFGEENDRIGERMHKLTVALLAARSVEAAVDTLYDSLREDFSVPHAHVRVWDTALVAPTRPEAVPVGVELCEFADRMVAPYCGSHAVYEVHHWFGDYASHLRSFAAIPLRGTHTFGLLVLASEDAQRFYPEMGTVFLQRLGEILSAVIVRESSRG